MRRRRRLRPRDAVTWRRSATVRPAQRNEPAIVPAIGQEAIEPAMSGAGHQRRANDPDPPRSPPDSTPSGTSTADHQDHPGRRCCRPTNPATGRASPGAGRAVQIGKARRHDVVPLVRIPRTVRRTVDRCHLLHLLCPIVRPGSHRRFHGLNRLGMSPRQAPSQAALPMQRFAWIRAATALAPAPDPGQRPPRPHPPGGVLSANSSTPGAPKHCSPVSAALYGVLAELEVRKVLPRRRPTAP
jgi:hypothetical protein